MALTKVPNNLITVDAIDGTLIANNAINSEHYTDGSIDTAHIAADQITSALIADDQIDSEHYAAGSIDTAHIAADQITSALIADDQIDSEHIIDGSIDTAHFATGAINAAAMGGNSVATAAIQNNAVRTDHISAGHITLAKMAANSIDSDQYVDGSIDAAHLAAAQTNITSLGTLTTLTVDDITINSSTISDAADLTIDAGGDIYIDADGGDIVFKDGGTDFGEFSSASNHLNIKSSISDADIKFKGNDGGSTVTALTLDMSDAGTAIFNHDVKLASSGKIGIGISPAEMLDIQSASGDARIRLDAPSGSDTEVKFYNAGSVQYTIGHDDATDNFVIGGANVDTPYLTLDKSANVNITGTIKENDIPTRSRAIAMAMVFG